MKMLNRPPGQGFVVLAAMLAPQAAWAAGFQINEHSALNTGMASSVVATVDDASAVFHNPAGLTSIEGTEFQVGSNLIVPHGRYTGPGLPGTGGTGPDGQELVNDPVPVPYVYAARALSDKAFIGLGFYLPYGSGLEWRNADEFVGRTQLRDLALRTFYFTPSVALKLNDMISVAVGVSLVPATLLLRQEVGATDTQEPLFPQGSLAEISATAFGVGANAGIQLTLIDHLKIGFVYKSAVDLSFSGEVNFTVPEDAPLEVRANFPDQTGNGDITLPHSFGLGLGWEQGPLTAEIGAQLTLWESYEELRLNFDTGLPAPSQASPKDWENVFLFRLGLEYRIGDLALRAGGGYDVSPIPQTTADFTLPDNDRIFYSLGVGYDFGVVRADIGYMGLWLQERELTSDNVNIPAGGTFNGGFAHVASLSFGISI